MEKKISPIGYVKNDYNEKFRLPSQSGKVNSVVSEIIFYAPFNDKNAFIELEGFSHVWLLFDFSLCKYDGKSLTVRPPRLGGNKHVGVFASRAPYRPNSIGLSAVKIIKINDTESGITLTVSGADLLDGTPIYDVKPYLPQVDNIENAVGGYSEQFKDYALNVTIKCEVPKSISNEKLASILDVLKEDPRPSYQNDTREYGLTFGNFNVKFFVKEDTLFITEITEIEKVCIL